MRVISFLLCFFLLIGCNDGSTDAAEAGEVVNPPTLEVETVRTLPANILPIHFVYVPVYSEIYYSSGNRKVRLTATLSIRNTSPTDSLYVETVDYYDTHGNLLTEYVQGHVVLRPLETVEFIIEDRNSQGGTGANFLVRWAATQPEVQPIIQCVMIGVSGAQGISFLTEGHEIPSLPSD